MKISFFVNPVAHRIDFLTKLPGGSFDRYRSQNFLTSYETSWGTKNGRNKTGYPMLKHETYIDAGNLIYIVENTFELIGEKIYTSTNSSAFIRL